MVWYNLATRKRVYSDVNHTLPPPKLTPKVSRSQISGDFPTLVRKGQEHVLGEAGAVAFMSLSQMLNSFDMKLSTAAQWYYFKEKGYPLVVTPEVAFGLAYIIKQTEEENRGFGALLKRVQVSNDLVPEELELGLLANAELETMVFDAWREVVETLPNKNYSHDSMILRVDVRVVASAMARVGKGLETYVITTAPEIASLVGLLGQHYPIRILGSDVPIHDYYKPALEKIAALLTEDFVAALPGAGAGFCGIFKEVEVIAGSGIKKLVGFKVANEPNDSAGEAYITAPIVPEGLGFESFPLSNRPQFLIYKPSEGRPARLVGRGVMQLNERGELVDRSGNYKSIPLGSYFKDSGISKSPSVRETARDYLTKHGIAIQRPLSYAVIDDAVIASNLNL